MKSYTITGKKSMRKLSALVFILMLSWIFLPGFVFAADVNININAAAVTGTIPEEIFGQNVAVWEGTANGKDIAFNKIMADSGSKFVRYPGGSYADIVMWETVGISPTTSWMRSNEDCINFANAFGAKLQAIVNFSGYWDNTQHTQEETVKKAAEQVKYMNITRKLGIKYWEIGNEVGGYWEQGFTNALDYGSRFADFYKAMKAVDPSILIGAVSEPYDHEDAGNGNWIMRDMFAASKKKGVVPDFLIIHTYPNHEPMSPANDSQILTMPDTIAVLTANLDAMVKKYLGPENVGKIKYHMTEYRSSLGKMQIMTYVDALFTAQYILEMSKYGWAGANIWDIKNGIDPLNGTDFGIISQPWRFEAESAVLTQPAVFTSEVQGFSGGGYVAGFADNNSAAVSFEINILKAGDYDVIFRYSNGMEPAQKLSVYVNKVNLKDITFPKTGDWKNYAIYTEAVKLNAGINTLTFISEKGDGRINLDYISVSGAIPPTTDKEFRLPVYNNQGRPTYYVFPFLINKMGRTMVGTTSSNSLIRSYTSKDAAGNLTLFLANNSLDSDISTLINLKGFVPAEEGEKWVMEPAGLTPSGNTLPIAQCADVKINGLEHPDPASIKKMPGIPVTLGTSFGVRLPKCSMMIIKIPAAAETPMKYEAEKVTLTGGAYISTNADSYSGTGFASGFENKPNASVLFKLSVPSGGKYRVTLRYANGTTKNQSIAIYLNNTFVRKTICAKQPDWSTWAEKIETLTLAAGNNEIAFKNDLNEGIINIDYILLVSVEPLGKQETNVYEAENAVLSGGAWAATGNQGYSGAAYVEGYYNKVGASTAFKVKVPVAGDYKVSMRYSNSMGSQQKISVYVNGKWTLSARFPNLKDWSTWEEKAEIFKLNAGENIIAYQSDLGDGCVNFDYIRVDPADGTVVPAAVPAAPTNIYEAEDAILLKGAWAASGHQGFSGSGYVEGYYNNIGASTTFKVRVATAGKYTVTLRFCNSMGKDQKITIYVGETKAANPVYPNLKDWNTWSDKAEVLTLNAGENLITYKSEIGDGCINIDYIKVEPVK